MSGATTTRHASRAGVPAPPAPGRLGRGPRARGRARLPRRARRLAGPAARRARRAGREVLASAGPRPRYTGDITLAMTLWQAVADREAQLRGGLGLRPGRPRRARADGDAGLGPARHGGPGAAGQQGSPLALSVPEACRLSDAVVGELRERLGLDPSGAQTNARVAALRAQLERLRDQTALEPAGPPRQRAGEHVAALAARLAAAVDKAGARRRRRRHPRPARGRGRHAGARPHRRRRPASRGRRPGGPGPGRAGRPRAAGRRAAHPRGTLRRHRRRTPRATPSPTSTRSGPLPNTAAALTAYEHRLDLVGRALGVAEQAYAAGAARPRRPRGPAGRAAGQGRGDRSGRRARPGARVRDGPRGAGRPAVAAGAGRAARHPLRHLPGRPGDRDRRRTGLHPAGLHRHDRRRLVRRLRQPRPRRPRSARGAASTPVVTAGPPAGGRRRAAAPSPAAPAPSSTATATSAGPRRRRRRRPPRRRPPRPGAAARPAGAGSTRDPGLQPARLDRARLVPAGRRPSRATRRVGSGSQRLRAARLGAGLTRVPPAPVVDAAHAVLVDAVGAREQAVLRPLRQAGRPRPRRPARTARGLLRELRGAVLLHPQAQGRRPGRRASTRSPAPWRTAASAGSTWRGTRTCPTAGSCSRAC